MGKSVKNKVERYGLVKDVVVLRQAGFSFQEIADELNSSGKVPENDAVSANAVRRYLERVPEVSSELVQRNDTQVVQAVDTSFNIIRELKKMYDRADKLMDNLLDEEGNAHPQLFKQVSSEMRATMEIMLTVQKEMASMENVEKFMEIVLQVVSDVSPEALPIIVRELEKHGGTALYAQSLEDKAEEGDDDESVIIDE